MRIRQRAGGVGRRARFAMEVAPARDLLYSYGMATSSRFGSCAGAMAAVLAGLAGCGDDGGGDGAADAAIDAEPQGVVGIWQRPADADPEIGFERLVLRANGTYAITGSPDEEGVYQVADDRITLDPDGAGQVVETQFALTADRLAMPAFFVEGTATGFVGSWRALGAIDGVATTNTMILRADQSAALVSASSKGSAELPGTWALEPTGFVFDPTDAQISFHFRTIDGGASISYLALERVP